jgi:oligopeptide/dipeptide ABC transporter ATP-binding protein
VSDTPLVELIDVHKRYGATRALDGVSLQVGAGETLGIVGESGCGKSTIARLTMGLERPTAGEIRFRGRPYPRSARRLRTVRRQVGIVFQDPYDSLDPRFTLEHLVDEPLRAHGLPRGRARVAELLAAVGMENADLDSYAGEYSGGQRQRIGIARALALEPEVIVCDEPTSALDVSVQAQILNLLLSLQRERGLAYLFISHDLEVVRRMSDWLAVIYAGTIVETGSTELISRSPSHPYTRALLDAVPATRPSERHAAEPRIAPEPASAQRTACPFHPRCPRGADTCVEQVPAQREHEGRLVACHFPLAGTPAPPPVAGAGAAAAARS